MDQAAVFQPQATYGTVLCCLCGIAIPPNPTNMCVNCIRSQVDITEGVQKSANVYWCKACGRYLNPPKQWIRADPESKELLTFCIKRLKGLNKLKLVDASFIWTEAHSKRLQLRLTVQREVLNGAVLQQELSVELTVVYHMCPDCNRANTNVDHWVANVQVRQHTEHRRTFLYLEQLILAQGADAACVNVRQVHQGLDFFFANRSHALRLVDFLQASVPCRHRGDKQLVSHDTHTSTYNYKYTFSVEIVPVCKDDLLWLPGKLGQQLGGLGQLVICHKVSSALHLLDPVSLRIAHMDAGMFWRQPLRPLFHSKQLVEYVVLDMDLNDARGSRMEGADVTVARAADFGANDAVYFARTHLGHVLNVGDMVWGYDVANANVNDEDMEAAISRGYALPDVILIRKSYREKRQKRRQKGFQRGWQLRRLAMEVDVEGGPRRKGKEAKETAVEQDTERFYEELEEDAEMRARVAMFKAPASKQKAASNRPQQQQGSTFQELANLDEKNQPLQPNSINGSASMLQGEIDDDDDDGSVPEVPLEELLEGLEALQLQDGEEWNAGEVDRDGDEDMQMS